jgi:hypothetical protein
MRGYLWPVALLVLSGGCALERVEPRESFAHRFFRDNFLGGKSDEELEADKREGDRRTQALSDAYARDRTDVVRYGSSY